MQEKAELPGSVLSEDGLSEAFKKETEKVKEEP